jgi:hypothetical protein
VSSHTSNKAQSVQLTPKSSLPELIINSLEEFIKPMNEDLQMLTPKEEESKIEALKDELL